MVESSRLTVLVGGILLLADLCTPPCCDVQQEEEDTPYLVVDIQPSYDET